MKRVLPILVFAFLPLAAVAAEPGVDDTARAIYGEFMSPYCPGLLLADCRSQAAVDLRARIHAELAAGRTADEVRSGLAATYGEKILAAPRAQGFGLMAWLTPGVFVLIGAGFVLLWAQRRRDAAGETVASAPAAGGDAALQARLERELRTVDAG